MIITYPTTGAAFWRGEIDLLADDIKAALLLNHTPNKTNDRFSDVSGDEVTGAGYSAGGVSLTTKVISVSSSNVVFNADDVEWDPSTITADSVIIYKDAVAAADCRLIVHLTFGEVLKSSNDRFRVQFHPTGITKVVTAG